jgi:beta-lactamase regulating signal transducer with metallopeptidase domain
MTAAASLDQLARICAGRMLNSMLEGIAIGLFAWILLRVVGQRNSSTRFAVWFSALLAIAMLPVLGLGSSTQPINSATAITVSTSWALGIFAIWAIIASTGLARVTAGLWQLRKLRATCTAIDSAALGPALRATLQDFQTVRSVTLCQSDRVQVPTAIGFLKPLVVIPAWALQELSATELNSILIHELAHLRRWDDWTNLAQQIVKALLFFHPAVWWIENKLALEREMACDDAVLAETANPKAYAQCLVSIAEKSFLRRTLAMAQAAVSRVRQTSLRVAQILDANRPAATHVWKPALYSVAAFSAICLISSAHAPELVAFEDRAPELAIASANSANEMLTAAAANFIAEQAVATPLIFHPESTAAPRLQKPRIRKSNAPATEKSGFVVAQGLREGTSSLVPQTADSQSGFQPLPANTASLIPDDVTPQTILVVMQSEQYTQTGPMLWKLSVWQVVVFDSSQTPVETRLPAKRI